MCVCICVNVCIVCVMMQNGDPFTTNIYVGNLASTVTGTADVHTYNYIYECVSVCLCKCIHVVFSNST